MENGTFRETKTLLVSTSIKEIVTLYVLSLQVFEISKLVLLLLRFL